MSYVKIEALRKHFAGKPPTVAVDDLDLEIEEGEFLVLLGPSGCGKTTTLRCLAGLETPAGGRISLGKTTVFDSGRRVNLSPDKRNIGMVFQSYALWPHMSVRKNIAYPLRARGMKQQIRSGWVEETAALVDCQNLLDRYPAQLSGGQQQRVALARGLVARPDLVLFDEPLSNLDARLRDQVRAELHELHRRIRFTAVFVTHDQQEALALGDRMAIMRSGRIEQFETPERVFEHPATEYVAAFIGMSNRLVCDYADGSWRCCGTQLLGSAFQPASADRTVAVRLRPDDVRLVARGEEVRADEVGFGAKVVDSEFGGRHMDVVVDAEGTRVHARIPAGTTASWARKLDAGEGVIVAFRPADAQIYDDGVPPEATDPELAEIADVVAVPAAVTA